MDLVLVLRQEWSFFDNHLEARASGTEAAQVDAVRAIFAELGVALVVEP